MKKILTVDDSASVRQMIKLTLSGAGYQVTEAVNGADGLAKAQACTVDLVVPVIFLTTESDAEIKKQAKAAGATGWITKPFQQDQLLSIVKKVLGQ